MVTMFPLCCSSRRGNSSRHTIAVLLLPLVAQSLLMALAIPTQKVASSGWQEAKLARILSWFKRRELRDDQAPKNDLYAAAGITPDMVHPYGQCGGKANAPGGVSAVDGIWNQGSVDAKCWPGWECKRVNQWYWQCKPSPTPAPPRYLEVSGTKKLILGPWAQCGGKGGKVPDDESPVDSPYPFKVCLASTCTRQNQWYWQCLPDSPSPPPGSYGVYGPAPGSGNYGQYGQYGPAPGSGSYGGAYGSSPGTGAYGVYGAPP